ncbi:MAG: hypothetical protein D6692_12125 [Planctomycetota bacterium]|nr:MAG: hypothetical protein D6692_12125 [Planctomycetota bacterium]
MPKIRPGRAVPAAALLAAPAALGLAMFRATADTRGGSLLPDVVPPSGNPITEEKRVLGKILFYEEQLSTDNTTACATCHQFDAGGADKRIARNPGPDGVEQTPDDILGSFGVIRQNAERAYSHDGVFGFDRQITARSAPPVVNAALSFELFWDGRASDVFMDPITDEPLLVGFAALESQSVAPPRNTVEMAHADRDWASIAAKLAHARPLALTRDVPPDMRDAVLDARTYPELFERAFGDPEITPARIAMALATYQRTLISDQTPWDRFILGDPTAMTPQEQRGWQVFINERCTICHVPPIFTDNTFRNIGLRPIAEDRGRENVTGDQFDAGKFKVPGLRNVGLKSTFMHTGGLTSLTEVIDFYSGDDHFLENIDPFIPGINISPQDRVDLVEFLRTGLTDPRVAQRAFPFDGPSLFFNADAPSHGIDIVPGTGRPDSTGRVPAIVAWSPPLIGSDDFKIGLYEVAQGSPATLVGSTNPPTGPAISPDFIIAQTTAVDPAGSDGAATAFWPIPFSPALDGQVYYLQWQVADTAQTEPALSEVVRVEFFCGFGDCATGCLPDFNRDQALTFQDIVDFLDAYTAGDRAADLAAPVGTFNFFDIATFISAYSNGCP